MKFCSQLQQHFVKKMRYCTVDGEQEVDNRFKKIKIKKNTRQNERQTEKETDGGDSLPPQM